MGSRLEEIARRKERLIERCARDREDMAASFQSICLPFNLGTLILTIGKALKAYPLAAVGVSSLLVTGFGAKLTRTLAQWFRLFRIVRPLWSWWSKRRRGR